MRGTDPTTFWDTVIVAADIATALATVFTLPANLWWRRHDRKSIEWVLVDGQSTWMVADSTAGESGESHATDTLLRRRALGP